ncbi:MAG: calcium-translocating P-type ATPase, SERCA-type [Candidatus Woesearchaeota archaeon]
MYHNKKIEYVFKELNSSEKGLSNAEALKRLETYGRNEIQEGKKISPIKIFINQFKSFLIYILIAATIISFFLGEFVDAVVILSILIINAFLGFFQEYRAEKAIDALKKLAAPKAKVIRDGKYTKINASELVPGDIIFIEAGDKIPADARLIELSNLETQEASLTGESSPVVKEVCVLSEKMIVSERRNMVFTGTIVTKGHAKAIVVATGMNTEIGKIAKMIQTAEPETTPLQKKLDIFAKKIGIFTIIASFVIFLMGILILKKISIIDLFLTSVSLAVAVIPEGLPAVVTITLAIGIQKMVKKNALIRKLPAVETLGSTDVICTDKTGTLTKNEMTVKKIFVNNQIVDISGEGYSTKGSFFVKNKKVNPKSFEILLKIGLLCNDARIYPSLSGDPTEAALIVSAEKAGLSKKHYEKEYKRIDEIPFDSERKMMSTLNSKDGKFFVFSKGAVENILKKCSKIYEDGKIRKITSNDKRKIIEINKHFAEAALRVLAFAYKPSNGKISEDNMIFVGLQAMIDPPREDAIVAMEKCKKAGIKVIMITGDHEITAKAIGEEFGLGGGIINGEQLERMSEKKLREIVEEVSIFARVNPEHKIKIVRALQANHHIVAMTGDGVNDAPAIKKADIGIAMGITGTDVAKEASVMILTDDNFASIVNAVEEGRGIYENIRKFFAFLISGNIGELLIILLAMLLFFKLPLTAIQILLINLFTDGLPAIALGFDPYEPDLMSRKPRTKKEQIYKGMWAYIIAYPLIMTLVSLIIFWWVFSTNNDIVKAQTAVFLSVVMFEIYQAISCRSLKQPVLKIGIFKNKLLLIAIAISLIVTFSIIFFPSLNKIFNTSNLKLLEVAVIVTASLSGAIFLELTKILKKSREL